LLVILVVLKVAYEMLVAGVIGDVWVSVFPFLAEPPGFALDSLLGRVDIWFLPVQSQQRSLRYRIGDRRNINTT
jgi:hypothetical protein